MSSFRDVDKSVENKVNIYVNIEMDVFVSLYIFWNIFDAILLAAAQISIDEINDKYVHFNITDNSHVVNKLLGELIE